MLTNPKSEIIGPTVIRRKEKISGLYTSPEGSPAIIPGKGIIRDDGCRADKGFLLIGSSGKGGATLHRRIFGEGLENLSNSGEYHWMAGNYIKYCAIESKTGAWNAGMLPVDSHELIALCAPRLVFISYGIPEKGDALWLDQYGSWQATVAAGEVFKLLGAKDLGLSNDYRKEPMPPVLTGLLDGELAWRQHDGGHTDGPNMKYFIEWATGKIRK